MSCGSDGLCAQVCYSAAEPPSGAETDDHTPASSPVWFGCATGLARGVDGSQPYLCQAACPVSADVGGVARAAWTSPAQRAVPEPTARHEPGDSRSVAATLSQAGTPRTLDH